MRFTGSTLTCLAIFTVHALRTGFFRVYAQWTYEYDLSYHLLYNNELIACSLLLNGATTAKI